MPPRHGIFDLHWTAACLCFFVALASSQDLLESLSEVEESGRILSRQKRYLIFPQGANVQLVYCLTIKAYTKSENDVVVGMTAAMAWELPSKLDSKIPDLLHRRSRSVVFPKMEAFLQSIGLDGRSCVMRALCEAGKRDPAEIGRGTFVQELLHAIFTLPNDGTKFESTKHQIYDQAHVAKENCATLYSTCKQSIYDLDF